MEKKRPLLSIRPQFDPGLAMVQSLLVTAVGFILVTGIGGLFTYLLLILLSLSNFVSPSVVFGFYLVLSLAGLPPLYYELKKRAFQRTLYNFYDEYVDFQYFHWYLNRRRGRVWYRDIADVTQHATALQEHQRLTTILLYVPNMAGGGYGQRGFSGVKMEDLQQSKGYLTKVMDVLEMGYTGVLPAWARNAGQPAPRPMFAEAEPPPGGFALPPEAYAPQAEPAAEPPAVRKS